MSIDDISMRWQHARLGAERVDDSGQRWVSVEVPHDGDPREDVRQLAGEREGELVREELEARMPSLGRMDAALKRADELIAEHGPKPDATKPDQTPAPKRNRRTFGGKDGGK